MASPWIVAGQKLWLILAHSIDQVESGQGFFGWIESGWSDQVAHNQVYVAGTFVGVIVIPYCKNIVVLTFVLFFMEQLLVCAEPPCPFSSQGFVWGTTCRFFV